MPEITATKTVKVQAKTLKIHLKVRDEFCASLVDQDGEEIFLQEDGYVPGFMPGGHYGDYVILDIDMDTGQVTNWKSLMPKALKSGSHQMNKIITDAMVEAALDAADYIPNPDNRLWMRAALTAALAKMWRPISEAPRDGTEYLVFGPDGYTVAAYYSAWEHPGWLDGNLKYISGANRFHAPAPEGGTVMAVPYAGATSGHKARDEITTLLRRFGCESVGFMDDFDSHSVLLAFNHRGRQMQLRASAKGWATLYLKENPWSSRRAGKRQDYEQRALRQGQVAVNSILRDWVKGQVMAVETGVLSFEAVFMPYILTDNGQTLVDRIQTTGLLPPPKEVEG